jgi:hypothetical protein
MEATRVVRHNLVVFYFYSKSLSISTFVGSSYSQRNAFSASTGVPTSSSTDRPHLLGQGTNRLGQRRACPLSRPSRSLRFWAQHPQRARGTRYTRKTSSCQAHPQQQLHPGPTPVTLKFRPLSTTPSTRLRVLRSPMPTPFTRTVRRTQRNIQAGIIEATRTSIGRHLLHLWLRAPRPGVHRRPGSAGAQPLAVGRLRDNTRLRLRRNKTITTATATIQAN